MILGLPFMARTLRGHGGTAKEKFCGESGDGSVEIKGARSTGSGLFHDMEVDHGRFDIRVAHQGLDGADVGAGLKEVRCK